MNGSANSLQGCVQLCVSADLLHRPARRTLGSCGRGWCVSVRQLWRTAASRSSEQLSKKTPHSCGNSCRRVSTSHIPASHASGLGCDAISTPLTFPYRALLARTARASAPVPARASKKGASRHAQPRTLPQARPPNILVENDLRCACCAACACTRSAADLHTSRQGAVVCQALQTDRSDRSWDGLTVWTCGVLRRKSKREHTTKAVSLVVSVQGTRFNAFFGHAIRTVLTASLIVSLARVGYDDVRSRSAKACRE